MGYPDYNKNCRNCGDEKNEDGDCESCDSSPALNIKEREMSKLAGEKPQTVVCENRYLEWCLFTPMPKNERTAHSKKYPFLFQRVSGCDPKREPWASEEINVRITKKKAKKIIEKFGLMSVGGCLNNQLWIRPDLLKQ